MGFGLALGLFVGTPVAMVANYSLRDLENTNLVNIPDEQFENKMFKKQGDLWTIKLSVDSSLMTEYFSSLGTEVTFKGDINYTFYFDQDGNLDKLAYSFDYIISGVEAHAETLTTFDLTPVKVNPPEDAESFIYNGTYT